MITPHTHIQYNATHFHMFVHTSHPEYTLLSKTNAPIYLEPNPLRKRLKSIKEIL